jgi:hypothetical protein
MRDLKVLVVLVLALCACGTDDNSNNNDDAGNTGGDGSGGGGGDGNGSGGGSGGGGGSPAKFDVTLVPAGASGTQRVNFAVPLSAGALTDESLVRVLAGTTEVPAARRALARYADGSARSVQLQVDVDVSQTTKLTVEIGERGATGVTMAPVESTLTGSGNNVHPKVWAVLPAETLAASTVFGPMLPKSKFANTALDAWSDVCDYERWDTDAFLVNASASRDVWLFDRVTAMYRGYALTGSEVPLESAYREASIYRDGMTISNGVATAIPIPTASSDLKYYYSQGMALHYLLTGDDRFREAAEAVSAKVVTMWGPSYDGTAKFWTERHAGFALLAHEWALMVTDDKAEAISARSEAAVSAFLAMQMASYFGQSGTDARCFAHTAEAHGEDFGGAGCSPWMSAILADALDGYQRRVGGSRAAEVRTSLGRMAKMFANEGRDSTGKPYYWMGVGSNPDEIDDYDEHWGEMAYVIALGWSVNGKTDAAMKKVADELIAGMKSDGEAGQVRSFNWQCRSAVMTPALLQ